MKNLRWIGSNLRVAFSWLLKRGWRRGLAIVVVLVLLAPRLLSWTPLPGWLAARALAAVDGEVQIGGMTLGWFVPIALADVRLSDRAGETIAHLPHLQGSRTLLGLLLNCSDLGNFHAEQAQVNLVFRDKTSNLEQALAKWLAPNATQPSGGGDSSSCTMGLKLTDSTIEIHDQQTQQSWSLSSLQLELKLEQELRLALATEVRSGSQRGRLQANLTLALCGENRGEIQGTLTDVPLSLVTPLLRRCEGGQVSGGLGGQLRCSWSQAAAGPLQAKLSGELRGQDVHLTHPLLGPDQLRLRQIYFPCQIRAEGTRVTIEQADLTCDVASASARCELDLATDLVLVPGMADQRWSLDVDLARLARQIPHALQLHPGTCLEAGHLHLEGQSRADAGGVAWEGHLKTTELRGTRAGLPVVWPNPIQVEALLRHTGEALPRLDRLSCQSGFLTLSGSGTTEQLRLKAELDLEKLGQGLSQFVDLNPEQMTGKASLSAAVRRRVKDSHALEVQTTLRNLELALGGWQFRGQGELEGELQLAATGFDLTRCRFQARDFHCSGPGVSIHEPLLTLQTQGSLQRTRPSLELRDTRCHCGSFQLTAPVLQADFSGGAPLITGQATVNGDLGTLARWVRDPRGTPGVGLRGQLTGEMDLKGEGENLTLGGKLAVANLVIGPEANPIYRDAQPSATFRAQLDQARNTLFIDKLALDSQGLACEATGACSHLSSTQDLDLQGQLRCDLPRMEPLLRPYLGQDVKLVGQSGREFRLRGPLSPPKGQVGATLALGTLHGNGGLHWQGLRALGCVVGPAEVQVRLDRGWVYLLPVQTTLNEGKLHLGAQLRLEPEPTELQLAAGQVLDRGKITPEMCSSALGYALPALANATQAEGLVSVRLEKGCLPPADFTRGEVKGTLVLHNARVAGTALGRELSGLLKTPPSYGLVKEATVAFHLHNGRVHHEKFELVFPDFTIRTSGSVGLADGTLALVVEMPIPPRWQGSRTLSSALAKQTFTIPLGGTVTQPRLDQQALARAQASFLREAAGDTLRQQLENRVPNLFRPRKN